MKARDVMTTRVATVDVATSVQEMAALMLTERVSGLPVMDGQGRVQGMVSEGDLMRRAETGTADSPRSWWLQLFGDEEKEARDYIKSHGATAGDVMTRGVTTIGPDEDIASVAMLLESKRIKRVPVLDGDRLVGIVSRADLLRGLATHGSPERTAPAGDREIRDALVAHLASQPWASSAMVNVTVNDGVVNLWGVFDSKDQHQALLVAARNTPGAQEVEDHMTFTPAVG